MAVTVVGELVVGSRKLLEALGSDAHEISGELERESREKGLEAKKIKENENSETLKC